MKIQNGKMTIYLAPLRGFTSYVFRNVFARFFKGTDLAIAPFISTVSSHRIRKSLLSDLLLENNREMPVVPQIISKDPDDFIAMAKQMEDMGYDTINWNLGCPYPQVAKKGRGSGMLPWPEKVDAFLEKVIPSLSAGISVKTRLGRYDTHEIFELMPVFNRFPLTELIIHPRTGIQMYEGIPDTDMFGECLRISRHRLVYNGDIRTVADFRRLAARFPEIRRWMIGRGLLSNPFLTEDIRKEGIRESEDFENRVERFREFHNSLFAAYLPVFSGKHHLVERMIGYWHYFADAFEENRRFIRKIRKTRNADEYLKTVNHFLDQEARRKSDKFFPTKRIP